MSFMSPNFGKIVKVKDVEKEKLADGITGLLRNKEKEIKQKNTTFEQSFPISIYRPKISHV